MVSIKFPIIIRIFTKNNLYQLTEDICKHHCTSCMNQARDVLFSCVECEDFSLCLQVFDKNKNCFIYIKNIFLHLVLCIWHGNWLT